MYILSEDGLIAKFSKSDGLEAIKLLRSKGYKYGNGECGKGLYSPNWDRMMGEWYGEEFTLNPSLLYLLS